jgi:hypothetical protein
MTLSMIINRFTEETPETELIKAACRKIVFNNRVPKKDISFGKKPVDWDVLIRLLEIHDLAPFFYMAFKEKREYIPEEVFNRVRDRYYYAVADNLKKRKEFFSIRDAFVAAGIQMVPIKGIALLDSIYDSDLTRPMTDIDILVRENDIERARMALRALGYRERLLGLKESYWLDKQCHLEFTKRDSNKVSYLTELHWAVDLKRKNDPLLPEAWFRLKTVSGVTVFSPEDNFFIAALHKRRFGRTLGLKDVMDAAMILDRFKEAFNWGYILDEADRGGMNSALFFMVSQVKFLLGAEIPEEDRIKISPPKKKMIKKFIEKNTFLLLTGDTARHLYLKGHLLLYDTFKEPLQYIISIPKEQFARFYSLDPYSKKTDFLYKIRFLYIFFKSILLDYIMEGR